jgi:hypothetical protein
MAVTTITFGRAAAQSNRGAALPLFVADDDLVSQRLTPTTTNQRTTIAAHLFSHGLVWVATDTAIWIKFGLEASAPDARTDASDTQAGRIMVPANSAVVFQVPPGVIAAVATAA